MLIKFDIAILSALNSNELSSVIYDVIHLSYAAKVILQIPKVFILVDNPPLVQSLYQKETLRLKKKNIILPEIPSLIGVQNYLSQLEQLFLQYNGKNIFYTLSSHGYSGLTSTDKSDSDNKDEYIRAPNIIRDNDFLKLFQKLQTSTKIVALIDTCSSGTLFDLRYYRDIDGRVREENKIECQSEVHSFSACQDSASDSDSISEGFGFGGGLTSKFLDFIRQNNNIMDFRYKTIYSSSRIIQ